MKEEISNLMQMANVKRYTINGGRGEGLKVVECDNGKIRFLLNESKALDVMQLFYKGENVSFLSKNAFSLSETPFDERFEGGMLYTCGLDSVGGREGFETHGSLHLKKAEITNAVCDENGITVEAIIKSTALFGKNLVLKRKFHTDIGADNFTLYDELINEAYRDEDYCVLYHCNLGYPMLTDGDKIICDVKEVTPRTDYAVKKQDEVFSITKALPCQEETCYYLTLGKNEVSLVNDKIKRKFTLSFSGEDLTEFVEWKSMASGDYALGLEPSTTRLDGNFKYKTIKAQSKKTFELNFKVSEL